MQLQNRSVFSLKIANEKTMFGVLTNTLKDRMICNIYNFAGTPDDHETAMDADILIYDLPLTGADFQSGWKQSKYLDQSAKGEPKDPYFVFGIPPNTLIKVDDPSYEKPINDPEELQRLLHAHKFLGFYQPPGNTLAIEETYLYGRPHPRGQHMQNFSEPQLAEFYRRESENLSAFQKKNVLDRWGTALGLSD